MWLKCLLNLSIGCALGGVWKGEAHAAWWILPSILIRALHSPTVISGALRWAKLFNEMECAVMCKRVMLHLGKWDWKASMEARQALLTYSTNRLHVWCINRIDWTSPDVILLHDTKQP